MDSSAFLVLLLPKVPCRRPCFLSLLAFYMVASGMSLYVVMQNA